VCDFLNFLKLINNFFVNIELFQFLKSDSKNSEAADQAEKAIGTLYRDQKLILSLSRRPLHLPRNRNIRQQLYNFPVPTSQ
jgi:hypothetical protein